VSAISMRGVADAVAIGPDASAVGGVPSDGDAGATRAGLLAVTALMLLPGALIFYLGFNAGGYFPATPAIAALVLTQVLLVRVMQSHHPFEGLASITVVAIAALGVYALVTLVSTSWSHSTGRALISFDRTWLYLVILVLFGSVRASMQDLRWLIRGLVIGASIVCAAGLISRVLPDVLHTNPDVSNQRLSYPVTYWNALGLLASLAIVLAFHLTCSLTERRLARILAAAVVPLLAATLFFTFSRGAIAAGAAGLVVYLLLGRPRGLLSGVLATVPGTAVLVAVAYNANLLDTVDPTTPAAVSQGHHVALLAGVCVAACGGLRLLLAIVLDPRLARYAEQFRMSPRTRWATVAGVGVAAVVVIFALGVPHRIQSDAHRFISGATPRGSAGDLRERLTDPSDNGRTDLWRIALHGFSASPFHGYGAGMYQTLWDRKRPSYVYTVNAHSLYLETMAELGVLGIGLVAILIVTVLVGLGVRARTPRRTIYAALLASAVVWALAAGVDWDWEMPVVTVGFFAIAGAGLSPKAGQGPGWVPSQNSRLVLGLLCLATLVVPVLIIGSQAHLDDARQALHANKCSTAKPAALSSIRWLDVRPEPYEILGFCDIGKGQPGLGVSAMERAVHVDPGSWETYYALAIAQAAAGHDPRPAAEAALEMNPLDPLTQQEIEQFATANPKLWVRRSRAVRADALASNQLSIAPS